MQKYQTILLMSFMSLFFVGCGSVPTTYVDGQSRDLSKVTQITCSWDSHTGQKVYIYAIDGKVMKTGGLVKTAYVKPGIRVLTLGLKGPYQSRRNVQFEAEIGKSYYIEKKTAGYLVFFVVEDADTHQIVASE